MYAANPGNILRHYLIMFHLAHDASTTMPHSAALTYNSLLTNVRTAFDAEIKSNVLRPNCAGCCKLLQHSAALPSNFLLTNVRIARDAANKSKVLRPTRT
jgi:hypothetical protein